MAKAKAHDTWTVLPHGPIEQLEPNLWRVEGTLPNMPLKRVMVIAAMATGELVIYSPIALAETEMTALDSLGKVAYIIIPNGWHRLDAKLYASRYPDARVLAPAGSTAKVGEVVTGVAGVDAMPADPTITVESIDGTGGLEAVMVVKSASRRSVVVADAVFNMPHLTGVQGFILKRLTKSSGGPRVSRIARLFMIKDKAAFASHLERLATPDLVRVIVGHHEVIADHPADALRAVAATLR